MAKKRWTPKNVLFTDEKGDLRSVTVWSAEMQARLLTHLALDRGITSWKIVKRPIPLDLPTLSEIAND